MQRRSAFIFQFEHYGPVELASALTRCLRYRRLLQQTLDEEKTTDKKLTTMAESKVNRQAA